MGAAPRNGPAQASDHRGDRRQLTSAGFRRGLGRGAGFKRVVAGAGFDAARDAEDDVGVGEHGEEFEWRAAAGTEQGVGLEDPAAYRR